jgi:hypothetical protein
MIKYFAYFYLISISFGLIGNFFSFLVFSRKQFNNTIFNVYFRLITITDSVSILTQLNYSLKIGFNIDIKLISNLSCKLLDYFIYSSCPISSYILVYISIDRMLNVTYPNEFQFRHKKRTQFSICSFIILFNMFYYIPILFYRRLDLYPTFNNQTNQTELIRKCIYTNNRFIYWMDLFFSTVIPFVFMFMFTAITILVLFRSKRRTNGISDRDVKFAITSIALNICFFLFLFPLNLFLLLSIYVNFNNESVYELKFIILLTIYSINYSNMFYVNLIVNSIFRNELVLMLKSWFKFI